jgi:phage shock protein E
MRTTWSNARFVRTAFALTAFALAAFVGVACNGGTQGVTVISQEALLNDPPDGLVILDVRTQSEYQSGHVPDAVNIPHDQLSSRLSELGAETSTPVVVYCERGGRAAAAEGVLLGAGYSNLHHLEGDMSAWRANGRPTVTP